jgi:hypothetical protein
VVYLYMDRLQRWLGSRFASKREGEEGTLKESEAVAP